MYFLFFPWLQRQGPINSYEDPRMACGFQSNYHLQRTCYPFWEEMATQEVPTGLEHCGSGRLRMRAELKDNGNLMKAAFSEITAVISYVGMDAIIL